MARDGYTAVPLERRMSVSEQAAHEMDMAFESDDEDAHREETPLTRSQSVQHSRQASANMHGAAPTYDFERDYDYPPPGSPPPMTASPPRAVADGNSNGVIPSPSASRFEFPRRGGGGGISSYLRRAVGVLLPTHYAPVPTSDTSSSTRVRGGGLENDGVFTNVQAKPTLPRERVLTDENGDVHVMPEEAQKDAPPSYAVAQADAVPPYWETTIHAPSMGSMDDPLIDGLPAGSIFGFAWNFLISISFQFVGFMVTYLLHTTHASKYGSRAGLGVTLIQYGLYSRDNDGEVRVDSDLFGDDDMMSNDSTMTAIGKTATRLLTRSLPLGRRTWTNTMHMGSTSNDGQADISLQGEYAMSSAHDWLSFLLMTLGWFLLLSSILGFARAKRWERSIRQSNTPRPPPTAEDIAREQQVRNHLRSVFGLELVDDEEEGVVVVQDRRSGEGDRLVRDTSAMDGVATPTTEENQSDAEFRRGLRAVGLI